MHRLPLDLADTLTTPDGRSHPCGIPRTLVKFQCPGGGECTWAHVPIYTGWRPSMISEQLCKALGIVYEIITVGGQAQTIGMRTPNPAHAVDPSVPYTAGYIRIWLPDANATIWRPFNGPAVIPVCFHPSWQRRFILGQTALWACGARPFVNQNRMDQAGNPDPEAWLVYEDDGPIVQLRV